MERTVFRQEHEDFRRLARDFVDREVVPVHAEWEQSGRVPRDLYLKLGSLGVLGLAVPEEYGGSGQRGYRIQLALAEELARAAVSLGAANVHTDLVIPYLLEYADEEQKRRWLPDIVAGRTMTALAMTEPGGGSDLAGIRTRATLSDDGSEFILDGAKTFITGGAQADLALVVCRTAPAEPGDRRTGLSILCVDTRAEGFHVGRVLRKLGMHASDTAELTFDGVRVPVGNLLGRAGDAFGYLTHNLVLERLATGAGAHATTKAAIEVTRDYVREREAFGQPVASFQNTKFVLAECATEAAALEAMVDRAVELYETGELTPADAAKLKLFSTEVAGRVTDKCLQLHGGYGYIRDYPISRLYADIRVSRIYAGSNEVMKTIIAKSLDPAVTTARRNIHA